jgi:hypothetical protein
MREFNIGCRTMRDGIVVSAVFLVAGLALLAAGKLLVPALLHMDAVVQGMGALLLLFVPFILVTTFLRTSGGDGGASGAPIGGRPASPPST